MPQSPHPSVAVLLSCPLLFCPLTGHLAAAEQKTVPPFTHNPIPGMVNHLGIKYLPDDRYSGDLSTRRGDYEMMLDLHLPQTGKGPFPVVFYVHGGAYGDGIKNCDPQMTRELAERGIASCGFNYILSPKSIFPQVWWDFHNAARFLRKNAAQYNLDPLRLGAYGISAGGWLISSSSLPDSNYLMTTNKLAITGAELLKLKPAPPAKKVIGPDALLRPLHDPAPAWPGEFGGFTAISFDFSYHTQYGNSASPAVQQWAYRGRPPGYFKILSAAGVPVDLAGLKDEYWSTHNVHCPPLFHDNGKIEKAMTVKSDGTEQVLGKTMADFFVRELLGPTARVPAPEIHPIPHVINGPTPVSILAPRGASIHYTIDGSTPSATSPVYQQPFPVGPGTTVRAIAVAPGLQPSGVLSAEFVSGTTAPTVAGPATLPPGETGKAYSVAFTCDRPTSFWLMAGDIAPRFHKEGKKDGTFMANNGMLLDQEHGVWSGTPTRPGNFWVQVWVSERPGTAAACRNYRWTVTGQDLSLVPLAASDGADRNQDFANLQGWPAAQAKALLDAFAATKLRVLTPNAAGDARIQLLVHADDRAKAETLLVDFLAKHPELAKSAVLTKP